MPLGRLTERARTLLGKFSEKKTVSFTNLIKELQEADGLGSSLIKTFPDMGAIKARIDINKLVKEAYYQSSTMSNTYVGTEHLLLASLKLTSNENYKVVKTHLLSQNTLPAALELASNKKENVVLETFGKNLNKTLLTSYKEPLVFREELNSLISVLLKREDANPLIVGKNGVGKDSLVQLLVRSIVSLDTPPLLAGYQVIEFDLLGYISSLANRPGGDFSFRGLKEELEAEGRIILYIKNFQSLFVTATSGVGVPIVYPIFKETLKESGVKFISTMEASIYERLIAENPRVLEGVTALELNEPEKKLTLEMLKLKARTLEEFHNVKISDKLLRDIYHLADDTLVDSNFPKKGIDLLDVSCANLVVKKSKVPGEYKLLVDSLFLKHQSMDETLAIGKYEVAKLLQEEIGLIEQKLSRFEKAMLFGKPLVLTKNDILKVLSEFDIQSDESEEEQQHFQDLEGQLLSRIIGQEHAVKTVVKALVRSSFGLKPKNRPVGSFLFLGPTGVGKTELAKVLADCAFGKDKKSLIRLDMSDFAEKHTVARLVGSPPGYIGYNEGGELTSKIELEPKSVVLFDEIEKAHPDVLNILLQIMEEGELSDAKGNVYDFSRAMIILTSNIGTEILHHNEVGFAPTLKLADDEKIEKNLKQNLKKILKPELLNRFDEVIVFRQLTKTDQNKVLNLLLKTVKSNLKEQNITLKVTPAAKKHLLSLGYSKEYGARALRRVVEKDVLDLVADFLLKEKTRPLKLKLDYKKTLSISQF